MNIKFDTSGLNNSSLPDSKVFITFAATTSDMVYDPTNTNESINFSGNDITIGANSYGTSKAYSLADIKKNTLVLNSATSLVGFISYGSATNIEKLATGSQPAFLDASTPRYSIFEISYDGTSGGADITNISQFGAAITMEFKNGTTVQSKVGNSVGTTDMFRAIANASSFSGTSSTPAIMLDINGKFLRAIGTNVFPNGPTQTPFPTFNAYLKSLYTVYDSSSIVADLTNLAPGANAGGIGSAGFNSTTVATKVTASTAAVGNTPPVNMIYNLDYHFTAVVTQVSAPNETTGTPGTYSVKLSGYVNATYANKATGTIIASHKYDNLVIDIAADDITSENLYMTNFIYTAAINGAGISVTSSGWDSSGLNNDFGEATVQAALLKKAAGDFAEGMTCGFPGSTTLSTTEPSKKLGELSSYEWWKNPQLAYSKAQTTDEYYSPFGNAIYVNSGGVNGVTFTLGGVYGSPYDDRFGLNLISPDANTTDMVITLLADGDLSLTPKKK